MTYGREGAPLSKMRLGRKLTAVEAAKRLKITAYHLCRFERGERVASDELLRAYAKLLHTSTKAVVFAYSQARISVLTREKQSASEERRRARPGGEAA